MKNKADFTVIAELDGVFGADKSDGYEYLMKINSIVQHNDTGKVYGYCEEIGITVLDFDLIGGIDVIMRKQLELKKGA